MDKVSPEVRSRMMSRIRSTDTKPEVTLRKALWASGLRFRKNLRGLPGTPDVAFTRRKVAVFVDGDFWHGRYWLENGKLPGTRPGYWRAKFEANATRDRRVDAELDALGWIPVRLWESDVNGDLRICVIVVKVALLLSAVRRAGPGLSGPS